jgi:ubiquinone/menaquinone biosynthesis C-methylase UbiE
MSVSNANKIDRTHYSYTAYQSDTVTGKFDAMRFSGSFGHYIAEHQITFVLDCIGDPSDRQILDLGAGTGRTSLPLSRMGASVLAADASDKMLSIVQEKSFLQGIPLTLARIDAHDLPFPNQSFDIVLTFRVIMHVFDWRIALSEVCRVSRDTIILDFPPKSGFAGLAPALHQIIRPFNKNHQSYRVFSVDEVVSALLSEGYVVTAMDKHLVLPFGLHRSINSPWFTNSAENVLAKIGLRDLFGAPVTLVARRRECLH